MLRVARAEATLALWPLWRGEVRVRRLRLEGADLLLETDAAGQPNWVFARPAQAAPETAPAATREAGRRLGVRVEDLALANARIAWRDGRTGAAETLEVAQFTITPRGVSGFDDVAGTVAVRGIPVQLAGEVGDLQRLADAGEGAPWPFRLNAAAAGATLTITGEASQPMRGQGWRATVEAGIPALESLAPLLPTVTLPKLRAVTARLALTDGPTLQSITATAGESDLGGNLPGLLLGRLSIEGGGAAPIRLVAAGSYRAQPLVLEAEARRATPSPITATLRAGEATLTATGTLTPPPAALAADLALTLRAPPQPGWPGLGAIEAGAQVVLTALDEGIALTGLSVATAAGDAAGEVRVRPGERPTVTARLASRRLDLAALRPAASPDPSPGVAPAPPVPGGPAVAPAPRRVIPDTPLPLDTLRRLDATIGWSIGELATPGATFRNATLEATTEAGRLQASATVPAGRLRLAATADAAAQPPTLRLTAASDGADAGLLLAALGVPGGVTGRLDLDVDLRGQGASLRPLAATATGHLGVALVDGRAGASLLSGVPREFRGLLVPPGTAGDLPLRCAALRADLAGGQARIGALLLDLPFGRLGGDGSLNLADETLAVRLFPDLRLGPIQLRAPVRVGGTLAAPRVAIPPDALVASGLNALLAIPRAADRGLQELAGAPPECPAALTAARGGRPGPMPATAGIAPIPEVTRELERRVPAPVLDLFRGLLGR